MCIYIYAASNQTTEPYPVTDNDVIDWLSNKEVIACVMSATEDIMDALRRNSQKGIIVIK